MNTIYWEMVMITWKLASKHGYSGYPLILSLFCNHIMLFEDIAVKF